MQQSRIHAILARLRACVLIAALPAAVVSAQALAEDSTTYVVEVSDVTAKVGEPAVMVGVLLSAR